MKTITMAEKSRAVKESPEMFDEYCKELVAQKIVWSAKGCKVNGKKAGRQKFSLAQLRVASMIYDNHNAKTV